MKPCPQGRGAYFDGNAVSVHNRLFGTIDFVGYYYHNVIVICLGNSSI